MAGGGGARTAVARHLTRAVCRPRGSAANGGSSCGLASRCTCGCFSCCSWAIARQAATTEGAAIVPPEPAPDAACCA